MSLTDVAQSDVGTSSETRVAGRAGVLSAALGAVSAVVSGLLLTCGIGLVLWAVTPTTGGPQQVLRASIAAFAAGHGMTLSIGRGALTLPPLMLTIVAVALLAGISGRVGTADDDRTGELTRVAVVTAVYAAAVTTAGVVLGTPGAVAAEQWWRPGLLALLVVGTAVFLRGSAWRTRALELTPRWFAVAVRLGAVGAVGVLAAGGVALALGLVTSFGDSSAVQTLAAPGPAAGFGMVLLGAAYLPNAIVAGAGYATGVGFHLGDGTYSPFGSSPVELPAVPLLAAAPHGQAASRVGMVLLLLPVLVALLIGRAATRRLGSRRERLLAVGAGAAIAGVLVGLLAAVAGGGVTGGQWAALGAPPLLLGGVTAVLLAGFGAAVAGVARASTVPEAAATPDAATPAAAADADPAVAAGRAAADIVGAAKPGATGNGTPDGAAAEFEPTEEPDAGLVAEQLTRRREAAEQPTAVPEPAEETAATDQDAAPPNETAAVALDDPVDAGVGRRNAGADTFREEAVASAPATAEARAPEAAERDQVPASERRQSDETTTVPQARREEDALAGSAASVEADLVDQRRPRAAARQVG